MFDSKRYLMLAQKAPDQETAINLATLAAWAGIVAGIEAAGARGEVVSVEDLVRRLRGYMGVLRVNSSGTMPK